MSVSEKKQVNNANIIETPLIVEGVEIANRVLFQPMEGCDGETDGAVSALTRRRYLRFAEGGAGIIWFEATAVCAEGRANPRQLYLTQANKDSFASLVAEIKQKAFSLFGYAPRILLQATHSGRYSRPFGVPAPIVAYRNALFEQGKEYYPYVVASDEYLSDLPKKYAETAALAAECGFDGVDVKCCHGYLFDELLSAYTRDGLYGGSLQNRARCYLDCIAEVRAAAPGLITATRLNAFDGFPFGYGYGVNEDGKDDLSEAKQLVEWALAAGVGLINVTAGNPYLIPEVNRPSVFGKDGAEGVKRITEAAVQLQAAFPQAVIACSGLSYLGVEAISFAENLLRDGKIKLAGFGRLTFSYPTFYADFIKTGAMNKEKRCLACTKCTKLMRSGAVTGCPMRDGVAYLPLYKESIDGVRQPKAVITGAARGIGLGVARTLLKMGYRCLLTARHTSAEIADLYAEFGANVEFIAADNGKKADRELIFNRVAALDGVDLLVNNAGVAPRERKDMLCITEEDYDYVMDVNLKGAFFLTQGIARQMGGARQGRIVFISSVSADTVSTNRAEYCISKAGISMVSKLFAVELAERGVSCFELRPGIIDTAMTAGVKEKYSRLIAEGISPIKRFGTPQDVASVVEAIAEGKLDFCTGSIINVDGALSVKRL